MVYDIQADVIGACRGPRFRVHVETVSLSFELLACWVVTPAT